ncbi:hypothetical protein RUM43_000895 [Polyplax serrata]|uniref:Sulfatase N-terminal domain-containing protein n=1 Tax=Polyplax serrata TaxID=468196 RepID=A0AAN8SDI0_POLSC
MIKFYELFLLIFVPVVAASRHHIITILIDDLGWNDVGFHGSDQIKTPNIDALAYSGMILNRHYVLPTCTPSRSALLTGLYPIHTGMQGYPLKGGENRTLPLSVKLLPEYLRELGYRTHMVGKWHLGFQTFDSIPNQRGFDSFLGYYNGYVDYYKFGYNQTVFGEKVEYFYGYDLHFNNEVYRPSKEIYATTLFTEYAEKVIKNHDASEPLFLFFSHLATHTGDDDIGMEVPRDVDVDETYPHIKHHGRRALAGCMEELDKSVGRVIRALDEKKMLENSIILLMSDNGAHTVSIGDMPPNWSSNWPLAGAKFTMYEGGVRGAALIWSPQLPKGVVNNNFLHITDWLPTLYAAAGGDPKQLDKMDGINQWDSLGLISSVKRDYTVLNINDRTGAEGILIGNQWKLIKGGFPGYGNYDYHWGKEENSRPNPKYNPDDVLYSVTGRVINGFPKYKSVFNTKGILKRRIESTVRCESSDAKIPTSDGLVEKSDVHRCQQYCLFDILNDPCELRPVRNDEILNMGVKIIEEIKRNLVRQRLTVVDPESNPAYFDGVWVPWDYNNNANSFSKSYLSLVILVVLTWYFFRR